MLDLATFVEGGFVLPRKENWKEIGKTRDYGDAMVQGVRRKQVLRSSWEASIVICFHLGTEIVDVWTLATCRKHPM